MAMVMAMVMATRKRKKKLKNSLHKFHNDVTRCDTER